MKNSTLLRFKTLFWSFCCFIMFFGLNAVSTYAQHFDVRHSLPDGQKLRYSQIVELHDAGGNTDGHILVGNIRYVSSTTGGIAVTRVDNLGNLVWSKTYNLSNGSPAYGLYDVSACILKDAGGSELGFAVGAHLSNGNATFTNKSYVLRFDLNGNVVWAKKVKNNNGYSAGEAHKLSDVVQNANTDIAFVTSARVSGTKYNAYVGHFDLAGNSVGWHREYNFIPVTGATDAITAIGIENTVDGGYILTGQVRDYFTNYQGQGALTLNKVAVWRLASNGDILWANKYDLNQQEIPGVQPWDDSRTAAGVDAIQTDDDNDGVKDDGFVISYHARRANYSGAESPGLIKLDNNGNFQWMKLFQGIPAGAYGFAMEVFQEKLSDDANNYKFITGGQHGTRYTVFTSDMSGNLISDFTKQYNAGPLFSGNQWAILVNSDKTFSMCTNTGSFSRTNDNFELPSCYTFTNDLTTDVLTPVIYGTLEYYSRIGYTTENIATVLGNSVSVQDYKCELPCNGLAITVTTQPDLECTEECDGSAEVVISGGNPDFTILWNDSLYVNSYFIDGLCAGDAYTVSVDDAEDCTVNKTIIIGAEEGSQGMGTGVCNLVTPPLPAGDPCGYNVDWALGLFGLPTSQRFFTVTTGEFDFDNGNTITATFQSVTNPNAGFTGTFTFGTYMNWGTWSTQGFPTNYKDDCGGVGANHQTWYYYIMTSGNLVGWGDYAGSSLNVVHAPANHYFGFQLGDGANNYNADFGFGGWLSYNGTLVNNGVSNYITGAGDLAFKLECCAANESRDANQPSQNSQVVAEAKSLSLYPVPAEDFLIVQPVVDLEGIHSVQVFDQLGQLVVDRTMILQPGVPVRLDVSILSSGFYVVKVSDNNGNSQVGNFNIR